MVSKIPRIDYSYIIAKQIDRISIKVSSQDTGKADEAKYHSYAIFDMILHLETLLTPHLPKDYEGKKKATLKELEKSLGDNGKDDVGFSIPLLQKWLKLLILIAHNSGLLTFHRKEYDEDLEEAPEAPELEELPDD